MRTSSGICVMQHPSSGMSVIMNVSITKKLGWSSIRTGIIKKKAHKEDLWYKQLPVPDRPRKSVGCWTRHGSLFTP